MTSSINEIKAELEKTLAILGRGEILSVTYDTAWVARLSQSYPEQNFETALNWLLSQQHADGSWGSSILHFHDRVICTLAALVTLCTTQLKFDVESCVLQGLTFLWQSVDRLYTDANDTINFRGLTHMLVEEAIKCGLDVPTAIHFKNDKSGDKLRMLKSRPDVWARHPIAHSLECFHPQLPLPEGVINGNGSIGVSPAATASALFNSERQSARPHESVLIDYLQHTRQPDGGWPTVAPIDVFEVTWSLHMLIRNGVLNTQDHLELVKDQIERIWHHWSSTHGIGYSTRFHSYNLDDTATAYQVLKWAGYPVTLDALASYETETHFFTFPNETDPSLSAHIRLLAVLKGEPDSVRRRGWIDKIMRFLGTQVKVDQVWTDKWHASPYYSRGLAATVLQGLDDTLSLEHITWILRTQRSDGGWGYYGRSTPEETAYALDALQNASTVFPDSTRKKDLGRQYLLTHWNDAPVSLWIGKCLYHPPHVVRSTIFAALLTGTTL